MTDTYLELDEDLERPVVTRAPSGPPPPLFQPLSTTVQYPPGPVPDVEDDVPPPPRSVSRWAAGVRGRRVGTARQRRRVVAGLLGVFLGGLGLHALYLGHRRRGLMMLAATLVGGPLTFGLAAVAMSTWGFVEGLVVLCARRGRFAHDAWGRPLRG